MGMIKLPKQSLEFFYENYQEIFDCGELSEGKWNAKTAELISSYTESPYSIAVNSNGSGLYAILRILKEYRSKKKIFLQSNTMYGVKTIAHSSGLDLIGYVDCSLDYLMPTYQQVKDFVDSIENPSDTVFLITHIGGWINPDIEKISQLCEEKGISLVEDCAHSLGSLLDGNHSGLYGCAGVYSLYATKAVPVGEGGIIVTKDDELNEMLTKFIMYDRFDQQLSVGVNLRMSEINALLTYSVILEIEGIIANKYTIASKYIEACEKYNWRYIDPLSQGQRSNLYKFILLSKAPNPEKEFAQIATRTSPVYDYSLGEDRDEITSKHICLPIWFDLESDQVDSVLSQLER